MKRPTLKVIDFDSVVQNTKSSKSIILMSAFSNILLQSRSSEATNIGYRFSSRASVLNELNSNLTNFIFGDIIGREFVKIVRGIQMMQKLKEENYPVRILVYIFGLFIMTLGISMSVKSDLGVSPVSSILYSIPF